MLTILALLLISMHLFGQSPVKYHKLELKAEGNGIQFYLNIYNPANERTLIVEFESDCSIDQMINCLEDIDARKAKAFLETVRWSRPAGHNNRWRISKKQYDKIKDAAFFHMTADDKVAAKDFTVI